jgi:hypothetical protein
VGDCPRCFEELRLRTRPDFEKKVDEVELRFRELADETNKELKKLERKNQELERQLY